jgi:hypothetical protein
MHIGNYCVVTVHLYVVTIIYIGNAAQVVVSWYRQPQSF